MTVRRVLVAPIALLMALAFFSTAAAPAWADPTSDAATALKTAPIYLDPSAKTANGTAITIDKSKIESAFGSYVKVAILPAGTSTNDAVSTIHAGVTGNHAFAVLAGNKFGAGATNLQVGYAVSSLKSVLTSHSTQLNDGQYTDALVAWAQEVNSAPKGSNSSGDTGSNGTSNASNDSGSSKAWIWLVGLGAAAVAGIGAVLSSRKRKRNRELAAAKDAVTPYYDRLASDVNTLNAGDDKTARQALADASERYTSAGSQMSTATTVAQWAAVRRTTLEGLQAAQTAREALGLPKGPELPPIDQARGEQLTEAQQVTVQGQQYQGYPAYTPGAPYYYGGGGGYAGGWYNFPFWETMLIGSMIGGGGWGYSRWR